MDNLKEDTDSCLQASKPFDTRIETSVNRNIEVYELKISFDILNNKIDTIKEKIFETKKSLNRIEQNTRIIQRKYEKLRNKRNVLKGVLSDAQIDILRGKKKTFWSEDDLAMAFSIRQMSGKECYLYLKNILNLPLPALSCVQKWACE